jgi:hypothetical protein
VRIQSPTACTQSASASGSVLAAGSRAESIRVDSTAMVSKCGKPIRSSVLSRPAGSENSVMRQIRGMLRAWYRCSQQAILSGNARLEG